MKPADVKQISDLLDQKLEPIHDELKTHSEELKKHTKILEEHGKTLEQHSKTLDHHGRMLRSLKKDQDTILDMLDREQMNQRKRLEKIEDHLAISPPLS